MKQNRVPKNEYIIQPKGKTNPYKHDVIYSDLGQWKYPGQVTRIPSNQITMQGVPYPVQGVDDTGYSQMMYPGMDYQFPGQYVTEYPMARYGGGLPKAQKGEQVEDNDSWLENIAEIVDPTGISSWDDIYRAYKNKGIGKELALESLGAIPFLGKVSKVTKPGIHLTKYTGIDQILKNTLPRNKSLSRAANVASKTGRGTDAVQAVLGAKDDSGFTWDLRHGEVPKYNGRNIFPQADLGETGNYAYGGDPSLPDIEGHYPFGGQNTKTHTHMKGGGSLNRKVTCSNCGWSWRLSDGGTDPMTCHKCGGTIKMQNGGWLDELDKAQFGKFLTRPLSLFTKTAMLSKPGKNMAYRKIGNSAGLKDLIKQKGAQAPAPMKMRSGLYADTPFFGMGKKPNENYRGIFAVEADPKNPKYDWTSRVAGTDNIGVAPVNSKTKELVKNVPLEDLNVYRKKWFSNDYKKLNSENLEEGLKNANLQVGLENAWKWGLRGAAGIAAHDYLNPDKDDWFPQIKNQLDKSYNKITKYVGPYLPKEEYGGWLDTMQVGGYKSEEEYQSHLSDPYSAQKRQAQVDWIKQKNAKDFHNIKVNYDDVYPTSHQQVDENFDYNRAYNAELARENYEQKQELIKDAIKKGVPRKVAEAQAFELTNEPKEQSTVQEYTPQSTLSKATEVLAHPLSALKHYKGHRLPDNFSDDQEEDVFSPVSVGDAAYQWLTGAGRLGWGLESADDVDKDLENKDYVSAGINAAFALPALSQTKKWIKKIPSNFTLKPFNKATVNMLNSPASTKMLGPGKVVPDAFSGADAIEYVKALGKGTKDVIKNIPKTLKYSFDNYKDIQKLPNQYKNAIKEMTTPEGLKRLKNLGVDDTDDFIKYLNNVQLNATMEGSHFLPVGPGSVNINPGQIKSLKKTILPLGSQENSIDHELGHAIQYYLENKGKTFNRLTDLDIEAVDELYPHVTEGVSNFLKNTTGMNYQTSKNIAENLGESSSNYLFRNKREPLSHLRETKRSMMEKGVINNIHEKITPKHIKEFISRGGDKDRILSFLKQTPEARKTLSGLLNRTPVIIPTAGAAGAIGVSNLQEEEDGGWLDDEYRRGGQKRKHYTSKNIQSSVNDLFRRNETLFGPAGRKSYKPGLKYKSGGGWLDNLT